MDAIVLLRDDHKTVEKLFKQFEKTGDEDRDQRRRSADQVGEELTVHARTEEQIFHPAARTAARGDRLEAEKPKAPRVPLATPSADSR